jgi:hypothetical protein
MCTYFPHGHVPVSVSVPVPCLASGIVGKDLVNLLLLDISERWKSPRCLDS